MARRLHTEHGVPVVGVPKTIDNDLDGTDFTFGFQTAVQIATDAIDRLHTTAESHNRVIIVEVMGRHAGWIAVHAGMAGGADAILIPERPFDIEEVCDHLRRRHGAGRNFSIVVVSEGAVPADGDGPSNTGQTDAFGHARLGGIAVQLEGEIEERTGYESRMTILGHVQRGGTPDRLRPGAGHPLRRGRRRRGGRRRLRQDGGPARHPDRARAHRRGAGRAQAGGPGAVRDRGGVLRMTEDLERMRQDYAGAPLRRTDLAATWLEQLERWIDEAVQAELPEPNAMVLATADVDAIPSARTVLLKGLDDHGLTFFTNLRSRKGQELAANARAAVVFPWIALHRQVIVDGAVEVAGRRRRPTSTSPRARTGRRWRRRPASSRSRWSRAPELEAAFQAVEDRHPERGPAARALGRPAPAPGRGGVLAGAPGPPARPASLPPHGGRVGRGAAGPLRRG